jgi:sulfoxide reductase catalytic subunit YedY
MVNKYKSAPVLPSEITPYHQYLSRRDFLKAAGIAAGGVLLAACGPKAAATEPAAQINYTGASTDEQGNPINSFEDITNYNNYYEFTVDKQGVAPLAQKLTTHPWTVEVGGLAHNPKTYNLEDLLKNFSQEEHVYRLRCVEAWSMVIPWIGFPLANLLKEVDPTSDAKYVRFESLYRPEEMPGQASPFYAWPYQEGLRIDEAMNELAILATGMYGQGLPKQDGAPIRLVAPWKYGFKSIKAVVKIELVAEQPATLWSTAAPNEYGFYSNVNPGRPHPRWSQDSERRIGELGRRPTLPFNGYGEHVAHLYDGMDLFENY